MKTRVKPEQAGTEGGIVETLTTETGRIVLSAADESPEHKLAIERDRNLNLVDALMIANAQLDETRGRHQTELAERDRIESELRQAIFQPTMRQAAGAAMRAVQKLIRRG